jgi:Ca2+-binding EF-hand superfamily protein
MSSTHHHLLFQARFFKEQDIDEFRDCFYLNTASKGQINTVDELKTIMRSLGMSPTIPELEVYLKDKGLLSSMMTVMLAINS